MTTHEFLPRNHSAKYGTLDKSNWKDLKLERNRRRIDPAIRDVIQALNDRGFKTFSSCSGGHKRNLHHRDIEHEPGYIAFFPASAIAYQLYSSLKNKHRHFELDVRTRIGRWNRPKRIETTELNWRLEWSLISKRSYYVELFRDMASIIKEAKSTRRLPLGA